MFSKPLFYRLIMNLLSYYYQMRYTIYKSIVNIVSIIVIYVNISIEFLYNLLHIKKPELKFFLC